MLDTHADFRRSPSSPHQCLHYASDGARCRATAMHNHYLCYAHRTDTVPPVIENDPFDLPNLDTYDAIQLGFGQVASRLACNRIDLGRAQLLTTLLRAASRNLRDRAQAHRDALRTAHFAASPQKPVILSEATAGSAVEGPAVQNCHPDPQNCHPERSAQREVEGPALKPVILSEATAGSAVEGPAVTAGRTPAANDPQNRHPERAQRVEGPAVALSPSSDNLHRTSDSAKPTSDNTGTANPVPCALPPVPSVVPPRDYTSDESDYLFFNAIQGKTRYPRPQGLTDQDIDDYLAFYRALYPTAAIAFQLETPTDKPASSTAGGERASDSVDPYAEAMRASSPGRRRYPTLAEIARSLPPQHSCFAPPGWKNPDELAAEAAAKADTLPTLNAAAETELSSSHSDDSLLAPCPSHPTSNLDLRTSHPTSNLAPRTSHPTSNLEPRTSYPTSNLERTSCPELLGNPRLQPRASRAAKGKRALAPGTFSNFVHHAGLVAGPPALQSTQPLRLGPLALNSELITDN